MYNALTPFVQLIPGPEEARTAILDKDELAAMGCGSLAVLDRRGNAWPVAGFSPDAFN